MSTLTEAVRKHHLALAKTLRAHGSGVGGGESQAEREAFVAFLEGDLLPHARGEERYLYPMVDTLVRKHGRATATMIVDHDFIINYATRIVRITRELSSPTCNGQRHELLRQLHELALRLDAIVELHLAKEERIYLPLIEEHLNERRQSKILQAIHGTYIKEKGTSEEQNASRIN